MPEDNITVSKGTYNKILGGLIIAIVLVAFSFGYVLGGTSIVTGQIAYPPCGSAYSPACGPEDSISRPDAGGAPLEPRVVIVNTSKSSPWGTEAQEYGPLGKVEEK